MRGMASRLSPGAFPRLVVPAAEAAWSGPAVSYAPSAALAPRVAPAGALSPEEQSFIDSMNRPNTSAQDRANAAAASATTTGWFNLAASLIGATGGVINNAITTGANVDIQRMQNQTTQKLAEFAAQVQTDPNNAQAAANLASLQALQAVLATRTPVPQPASNTNTILLVGLGVAALAVVYLVAKK